MQSSAIGGNVTSCTMTSGHLGCLDTQAVLTLDVAISSLIKVLSFMQTDQIISENGETRNVAYVAVPVRDDSGAEISLIEIWQILKARKRVIGIITAITSTAALLFAIFSTPLYRAEVLLSPAVEDMQEKGGFGNMAGRLGGLGGIVGQFPGGGEGTVEAVAILKSRAFTKNFLLEEKVLPLLYEKNWDAQAEAWYPRQSSFLGSIKNWLGSGLAAISGDRGYHAPASRPPGPSMEQAVDAFGNIRIIDQDVKTGLLTLSIEWEDPVIAAKWVQLLVIRINRTMRRQAMEQAKKRMEYLQEEVRTTGNKEMLDSVYSLIEVQMKKAMIANVTEDFAFRTIDPAAVPEKRSAPRRTLIVLLGIFAGLCLGMVVGFVKGTVKAKAQ